MALRMWERNRDFGESLKDYVDRVNSEIDALRAAGMKANYGVLADGTVFAQVGRAEPIRDPRTAMVVAEQFVDLSNAEIAAAIEQRQKLEAARASRPRILE